jgi:hypothetical protein
VKSATGAATQVLVCVNQRPETDVLGPGCGERGERLVALLRNRVAQTGAYAQVWVTRTHCQGLCPKRGASVVISALLQPLVEVEDADLESLWTRIRDSRIPGNQW